MLTGKYKNLASKGRYGDTMLAHITPEEAALLKARGGAGTINPQTGLPEFYGMGQFQFLQRPEPEPLPVLAQAFNPDEFKDVLDKLPTKTIPREYRGKGGYREAYEKILPEYSQYADRGVATGMGGGRQIEGYTVPTDKTFQGKPLEAKYDPKGNFINLQLAGGNVLYPDPSQPNIASSPKFNKTGGIVDYGVFDLSKQDSGGFGSMFSELATEFAPMILAGLGANYLAGSGLFTGAPAATGGTLAGMGTGAAGAATTATITGTPLAALTAGGATPAGLLAGGGSSGGLAGFGTGAAGVTETSLMTGLSPSTLGVTGLTSAIPIPSVPTPTPSATTPPVAPPVVPSVADSSVLSAISSATGISVDTLKTFAPSVLQGLLSAGGSYLTSEQAKEAAQTQADAQIRAAQIAADAARFRPVGVTTRFGSSNFTTDAAGNVTGAGYTASPEILDYQNRLSRLAGQGMTDIEGARAAYQPLTGAAQSLFSLGQGYLSGDLGQPITSMGQRYMQSQAGQPLTQLGQQYIASDVGQPLTLLGQQYLQKTPEQIAADYIAKQQALLAPTQENQLAQLQNRLFQQGRGGAATAQGGNLMATSPEMAAYYNALAQSNLQLAANAGQAGQQQTQFGADLYARGLGLTSGRQVQGADLYQAGTGLTRQEQIAGADLYRLGTGLTQQGQQFGAGLFGTGADLQGRYYTGQTAAYSPFTTAMDTSSGLERLAQQPLDLSTAIGSRVSTANANVGQLTGQGIINAASTMAPANAYSLGGNLLSGVAGSPNVTSALNRAFGVTPQPTQQQYTFNPVTGQYVPVQQSVFAN